ncbi:MAG: phospholipid carrier-dependent glycosyltransferase, partial [Porticoccaceae bacterium]|nr:phospholipid carrier-dependent glycosyltransferase [Porticoccaceae bacterium]
LYYFMPWTESLVSTGFELSNLDPFSYRWLNAVTGTALIYVSYKVSKELINSQHFAILVALFFCLDGAFIADSRIGLINIYLCFFGFLGLLYFLKWVNSTPQFSSYFLMAMVFLGLAISVKWNGVGFWGVIPAIILLFWCLSFNSRSFIGSQHNNFLNRPRALSITLLFLLLGVPLIIYLVVWIPESLSVDGFSYIDKHRYMADFHISHVEEKPHPYQSEWYTWPVMARPMAYYFSSYQVMLPSGSYQTMYTAMHLFPNPALALFSIIAVVILTVYWIVSVKNSFTAQVIGPDFAVSSFILIGFYGNFLPWSLVSRSLFLHHYQPASGFALIGLALVLYKLMSRKEKIAELLYRGILILVIGAAIYWLPLQLGLEIEQWRFHQIMWFDSWI